MDENIMVSICCEAYNHEKYIRSALDSFLMQKTNFKYEILINDDASTDSTAEIIREYEEKYPNIIKPIYQVENQYSQGIKIEPNFLYPNARGKYIALCNGDDYWTEENKLQMQVDFLEKNEDYSLSVHPSYCENENKSLKSPVDIRGYFKDTSFDINKYIKDYQMSNCNIFFQTSSMVFRKKYVDKLIEEKPDFYYCSNIGDINLEMYLLLHGKAFYHDKYMSVYRNNVPGSWTVREYKDKQEKTLKNMRNIFDNFNKYTDLYYNKVLQKIITSFDFGIHLTNEEYKEVIKKEYKEDFKKLGYRARISIRAHVLFPKFMSYLRSLKLKYKGA